MQEPENRALQRGPKKNSQIYENPQVRIIGRLHTKSKSRLTVGTPRHHIAPTFFFRNSIHNAPAIDFFSLFSNYPISAPYLPQTRMQARPIESPRRIFRYCTKEKLNKARHFFALRCAGWQENPVNVITNETRCVQAMTKKVSKHRARLHNNGKK